MNELELKMRVQGTIEQMVSSLAAQGVSFNMIEDALYRTLVTVKDRAHEEFIMSISAPLPEDQEEVEKVEE